MDLLFTDKEELMVGVLINGDFGCKDHDTAGNMILRGLIRARNRVQASAGFREPVGEILRLETLKSRAQEG